MDSNIIELKEYQGRLCPFDKLLCNPECMFVFEDDETESYFCLLRGFLLAQTLKFD